MDQITVCNYRLLCRSLPQLYRAFKHLSAHYFGFMNLIFSVLIMRTVNEQQQAAKNI